MYIFVYISGCLLVVSIVTSVRILLSRTRADRQAAQHILEYEIQLKKRMQELDISRERERQIINDVSHGLQTPLTILQTRIDTLRPQLSDSQELLQLEQSLSHFSSFIYELLSLTDLQGDALSKDTGPLSLTELLRELCEEVAIIGSEYGAQISCETTSDVWILGDKTRIRESLMNLASNSLKYLSKERDGIVTFTLTTKDTYAILTVVDNGMGIDHQDIAYIFQRFYRGKNGTEIHGTGLGLAITKKIIEQHGGTITVSSTLHKSSTFEIRIPYIK